MMTTTDKNTYFVTIGCPYCGNKIKEYCSIGFNTILCDIEESPGCDRFFAVRLKIKPITQIYKLKEHVYDIEFDADKAKEK